MLHEWVPAAGFCHVCGFYCRDCNDCKCPGKGWKRYALSACPQFDTASGRFRPRKMNDREEQGKETLRQRKRAESARKAAKDVLRNRKKVKIVEQCL